MENEHTARKDLHKRKKAVCARIRDKAGAAGPSPFQLIKGFLLLFLFKLCFLLIFFFLNFSRVLCS